MEDSFYVDKMQQTTLEFENNNIPRIVHQMWKNNNIPQQWLMSSKSWKILNPRISYMFWTDHLLEKFISRTYPWLLKHYKAYAYNIQRADMARYVLLFHFGGLYADLDVECRTQLDYLFKKIDTGNFTVGVAPTEPYGFSNDLIFAKPRSHFMKQVLLGLKTSNRWFYLPYLTVMLSTGSLYFTSVIEHYPKKSDIYILPQDCYIHYCFSHLAGGSWHGFDGRIIWSIFSTSFDSDFIIIILCIIGIVLIMCCMFGNWKKNHHIDVPENLNQNSRKSKL